MYCSNCGFPMPGDSLFCESCGSAVEIESTPEVIQEPVKRMTTAERINTLKESVMTNMLPPDDFQYDPDSGLYYISTNAPNPETGVFGRWITWFYPDTGEFKQVFLPDPSEPDSSRRTRRRAVKRDVKTGAGKNKIPPYMFLLPAAGLVTGVLIAFIRFGDFNTGGGFWIIPSGNTGGQTQGDVLIPGSNSTPTPGGTSNPDGTTLPDEADDIPGITTPDTQAPDTQAPDTSSSGGIVSLSIPDGRYELISGGFSIGSDAQILNIVTVKEGAIRLFQEYFGPERVVGRRIELDGDRFTVGSKEYEIIKESDTVLTIREIGLESINWVTLEKVG